MLNSLASTIGNKAQKVAQSLQEIQKDLQKENRTRGGGSIGSDFDEAEAYKTMLVGFQMEQAKLGKEVQVAMREKQVEALHWKQLYAQAAREKHEGATAASAEGGGEDNGDGGAGGALGVGESIKLHAELEVMKTVMEEWEHKLEEAFKRSTEETALRMKLEHEVAELNAKVKDLDAARAASEDLILSLSAEKTRMLGSSGEASETIDELVDEYSRLASEHTAQRMMDAETIGRLENVRDELVEKLKAHERNILQLLQRGESEADISREMTDRSVVTQPKKAEKADGDAGAGIAEADAAKVWTSEEVQSELEAQANKLRAEKETALAELRTTLTTEASERMKQESSSALSLAAEAHATALKRAVLESAATAKKEVEEALSRERTQALEQAMKAKDLEKEDVVSSAQKQAEEARDAALAALRQELESKEKAAAAAHAAALLAASTEKDEAEKVVNEQTEKLKKEMEDKIASIRKEVEAEIEAAKSAREETNALYAKENRARKAIHNKLMELQGNIRVLARVRPMLEVELASRKDADVTSFPADEDIVIKKTKESKGMGGSNAKDEVVETRFEFDRVFRPDSTQENVFKAVGPLVTSVLDGYNVCIFAYGQTGSGKTFTMEGPDANPGVNTRAITEMFKAAEGRSADVKYTFHMSMMEIYNEAVFDLLAPSPTKDGGRRSSSGVGDKEKTSLDIRQNKAGGSSVQGLTEVQVSAMPEVAAQLEQGGRNRAVGAHDMNEHSSRSHMIFNVRVEGTNVHTGAVVRAKLNLIDLAGSERISKTDATGERLREAQNINRSLSALGDVISALSQGKGHVPFRNSKLTFVLQDALSGNSKVMMFVNVSPASYNVTETLCSLNFAARCRSVKLGAAGKNQETPEVAKYRRANEALHAQLVAAGITPSTSSSGGSPGSSPSKNVSKK